MNKLTKTLSLTTVAIGLAMGSLAIASTEEVETVKAETNQTYTVQSGDNLYRIAVNNGMDVYDLAELNGMSINDNIQQGDVLVLSGGSQTSQISYTPNVSASAMNDVSIEFLGKVVQQEGGTDYTSARWVMSTIYNRAKDKSGSFPNTFYGVLTQSNQFESVRDSHWKRSHNNTVSPNVYQAIEDTLNNGSVHNYLFFQQYDYALANGQTGVNVGGNMFFSEFK